MLLCVYKVDQIVSSKCYNFFDKKYWHCSIISGNGCIYETTLSLRLQQDNMRNLNVVKTDVIVQCIILNVL